MASADPSELSAPPPAPPSAPLAFVGVLALFAYLIGGCVLAFVAVRMATDDGFVLAERWRGPAFAFGSLLAGVAFQAIREGRVSAPAEAARAQEDEDESVSTAAALLWPLGVMLAPLLIAWIQFELFVETITMFPLISVIGGVWLGAALGGMFGSARYRSTLMMLTIAGLSFPLALVSIALPVAHFRAHGSNVSFVVSDDPYEQREYPLEHTLPEPPPTELMGLGDETYELLDAMANAKVVEVEMIDGVAHVRNEAGALEPVEETSAEELSRSFDEALARDQAAQRAQWEAELAAHEEKVARLRRGGRLFSRP